MNTDLTVWALPRLSRLLPLDNESLQEVLAYSLSLSKAEGAEHLKNLLGDSAPALEFISSFNSRREDVKSPVAPSRPQGESNDLATGVPKRKPKPKAKAPLHHAGPVRTPEGFGNVAGGYSKRQDNDTYSYGSSSDLSGALASSTSHPVNQHFDTYLPTKNSQHLLHTPSPGSSRDPSPGNQPASRLPPSAGGNLISDLPNVRSKQSKKHVASHSQPLSGSSTPHGKTSATTTTSSIADLTSAIAALEIATNPSLSSQRRRCECNASIHPLFTTAPNCLSCGKIICALEGLQPCSFCDAPILTKDQVTNMIKALKEERGVERMAAHNVQVQVSGRGTPMFSSTPDSSSGDEASSAAGRARAHRDKLLAFQRENVQRTKIHDEAADYDMALTPGTTQWMSPVQRAAALKKQQRYLREVDEANRPEWEKKKTVMSMSIRNGKLVKTYDRASASASVPDVDRGDGDIEQDLVEGPQTSKENHSGAFSNNPLLKSGELIRPVWKAKDEGTSRSTPASTRARNSVWRRVQDDNEDNEQWILDGGIKGYNDETRLVNDGSQQECG